MKSYRFLKFLLGVFLGLYFMLGFALALQGRHEIYPVFSWFLFSKVPATVSRYGLMLHAYDGERLDPPVLYEPKKSLNASAHPSRVQHVIQRFGQAVRQGEQDEAEHLRRLLEANFLRPSTRYELVRIRYAPLERWRSGTQTVERLEVSGGVGATSR